MIKKKGFITEIIAEYEVGKTDFCSKIPSVFMADATPTGESDVIFAKYHDEQEFDKYYFHCASFNDIARCVQFLPEEVKTFVLDGSAYLVGMAELHWISLQKKNRESALQREYGEIYDLVRSKILYPLIKRPCNIVFTSYLKDQYIQDERTGKRERAGFKPMDTIRDIAILMFFDDNGMRQNKIAKNRFMSRTLLKDDVQVANPLYMDSLKPEASWDSLIKMITAEGSAFKKEWLL